MDWTSLLVAFIVALLSGGGVFLWRAQHHKVEAEANKQEAEASSVLAATALNIVKRWEVRVIGLEKRVEDLEAENKELKHRVNSLGERVTCLESENTHLRAGAMLLENQVVELGETPVWRVPTQV